MRQALHIFRKDVRHFRWEVGITLAALLIATILTARLAVTLVAGGDLIPRAVRSQLSSLLVPVMWWYLIARLVHDERIPGDRQFWVTRPYRWPSLLAAKALFLLVFVHLPLLAADIYIVESFGFSLPEQLPAILFRQFLLAFAFEIPVAGIAAVTTNITQFLLVQLGLLFALACAGILGLMPYGLRSLAWVRDDSVVALLSTAALTIVVWQYATRRTLPARIASLVVIAGAFGYATAFSPSVASKVHARISRFEVDPASIEVRLHPGLVSDAEVTGLSIERRYKLGLALSGLPAGAFAGPNLLALRVETADGRRILQRFFDLEALSSHSYRFRDGDPIPIRFGLNPEQYRLATGPVTMRGTLYFNLWETPVQIKIRKRSGWTQVTEGARCAASQETAYCVSLFREAGFRYEYQPARIAADESRRGPLMVFRIDSALPADYSMLIVPFFLQGLPPAMASAAGEEVPVYWERRLAHASRDFVWTNLHLSDYEFATEPPR